MLSYPGTEWRLSRYTTIVRNDPSSDLLLHNSFMGAIARIPEQLSKVFNEFVREGITEWDVRSSALAAELCKQGFFVSAGAPEEDMVRDILDTERDDVRFSMIIMPHEDCNFRCTYCYEDHHNVKMSPEVVSGLKRLIELKSAEGKNISVAWFGGEPLLAKSVIYELSESFLRSCANVHYAASITTNGSLLTYSTFISLLRCGVTNYQVTLDGPVHIHDRQRPFQNGKGTYKAIFDNLVAMKESPEDFLVRLRVNFGRDSRQQIEQWIREEIAPIFGDDKRFALCFFKIDKWGGKNDGSVAICSQDEASLNRRLLTDSAVSFGFSPDVMKQQLSPHGYVCYAAKASHIVVGADGTIYKCTLAFRDPMNKVGKVLPDGSLQIDKKHWDLWTRVDDKDTTKCRSCSYSPVCQSRQCPSMAMKEGVPPCPMTREDYSFLVKTAARSLSSGASVTSTL